MGIDFGTKKTGIAVSDENENIAFPYSTIRHQNVTELVTQINDIIKKENIKHIVIGYPEDAYVYNELINNIDEFIEILLGTIKDLEITKWNEVMTSSLARQSFKSININKKVVDSEAARIILQEFLDFKKE